MGREFWLEGINLCMLDCHLIFPTLFPTGQQEAAPQGAGHPYWAPAGTGQQWAPWGITRHPYRTLGTTTSHQAPPGNTEHPVSLSSYDHPPSTSSTAPGQVINHSRSCHCFVVSTQNCLPWILHFIEGLYGNSTVSKETTGGWCWPGCGDRILECTAAIKIFPFHPTSGPVHSLP